MSHEFKCGGCGKDLVAGKPYRAEFEFPKLHLKLCDFCIEVEPTHHHADWQKERDQKE